MIRLILFLFASTAYSAVTDVNVQGTTSTQAIISYTAPTTAACTVEVSRAPGYTPLVEDVNGTFYPGADSDNRPGNIYQGRSRIVVIGNRGAAAIAEAADGHKRSRALRADTEHYFRITCGGDTATGTFRTGNIPVGDTRGEALAVSSTNLWEYDGVTANAAVLPEFADPFTGALTKRPTALAGYGYLASTATNGNGDCNKTLAGVKGSCLFVDSSGEGWSATTGTLIDAVRADDSNFAEYSGTTRQPFYIRLGTGKYPTSSTPDEAGGMAFQNIILRALTSDASGDGGQIELCITEDGKNCNSPWLRHTLTTSEATVRFCKDVPCSAPDAPGDIMMDRYPQFYKMVPDARMYNEVGTEATLKFVGSGAQAFCDGLYAGQYIAALDDGNVIRWNSISSKSCGSSPPQVTVGAAYSYQHSGTNGVTVFWVNDIVYNPNYGILIRKVSTTSGSTIKIGYALWRMARSTPAYFALGSGGFGKRCQNVQTAQGEYLCQFGMHIVGISYGEEGLQLNNYGFAYVNGNYLGTGRLVSEGTYGCMGNASISDSLWDDITPGVMYCLLRSDYYNPATGTTDNRHVLVKMTLNTTAPVANGDPDAGGNPGLSNVAQRLVFASATILTPCLSPCAAESDDYTPYAQRKRYAPSYDPTKFASCALQGVQGKNVIEICLSGSQDSHGWYFVYDTGNGSAVGSGFVGTHGNTQQVYAGFLMPENSACRWCAVHTYQGPIQAGGAKYTVAETSTKCPFEFTGTTNLSTCNAFGTPGTCSACPNVTLDGYNYNGKNWCSDFTLTTAWNGAWGSTPAGFEAGDPIAPNGCDNGATGLRYFNLKLQVGDFIYRNGEIARIIEKTNNTTYKIIRGWGSGYDNGVYPTKTHANGDTWQTRCGTVSRNPETSNPEFTAAIAWWFENDPNGDDPNYTYFDSYQNHAFHVEGVAANPEYQVGIFDPSSASSLKTPSNTILNLPRTFAGQNTGRCDGNACEKHPAYGQILGDTNAKSWFVDVHPRLSHGQTGTNGVALVSGKTYIYQWQGDPSINPHVFDLEVYSALFPLRRVDTLTDSVADSGKWCWAVVANDCFSGSVANTVYLVNEAFDTFYITASNTCREAEFGTLNGDACVGNTNGISASTAQWRIPKAGGERWLNGSAMRVVSRHGRSYREAATENMKVDPLGKVLFARGNFYVLPPPFPGVSSRSGETFQGIPVTVTSVPAGTDNALIQFGYDDGFHCSTNRDNTCYAESATLDQATPYRFDHETLTGVSCGSGCTITIPAIMNRVVYWRIVYRNSGGTVIARGASHAQAVQ